MKAELKMSENGEYTIVLFSENEVESVELKYFRRSLTKINGDIRGSFFHDFGGVADTNGEKELVLKSFPRINEYAANGIEINLTKKNNKLIAIKKVKKVKQV
jgi:hypothetical protein